MGGMQQPMMGNPEFPSQNFMTQQRSNTVQQKKKANPFK